MEDTKPATQGEEDQAAHVNLKVGMLIESNVGSKLNSVKSTENLFHSKFFEIYYLNLLSQRYMAGL